MSSDDLKRRFDRMRHWCVAAYVLAMALCIGLMWEFRMLKQAGLSILDLQERVAQLESQRPRR